MSFQNTMHEPSFDIQVLAEYYDVQPQAIIWMQPIRDESNNEIIDFSLTYSNDEGLKYMNLTRQQLNGLTVFNSPRLTDGLRTNIFDEILTVYNTEKKSETTIFNPILNKYARILRTKLQDGVLTVVQDISKENRIIQQLEEQTKQLEQQKQQVQEQKALLDNILKNSSNGISVSEVFRNKDGKVIDALTILANDAAVKFTGLPKEIYLSKRATEIEPAIIGSPFYLQCINTLETGEPFAMQHYMESTARWLELTVSRLDYNHLIQIFTDVTTVKEVQLKLEGTAATLKSVFDQAQTGMFTFAPEYNSEGEIIDFRFGMVNSTVAEYAGQTIEALQGQLGIKWFPGYLNNGEFDMYKHCFETGESQKMELYYHFDGRDYYLFLQSVKIGEQLLVSLTDHTSIRKSQLDLEQMVKALELSNTHLEDFAHAASHDMKEPIRKIQTFSDRLRSSLDDRMTETEKALFERIQSSAQRMQLLVDDLLEFSHVSEHPQEMEPVDLSEKVQTVLADLELAIEEKKAKVIVHSLPVVYGHRRQLQQLFQNLIGNALKYNKPEVAPVITISSSIVKGSEVPATLPTEHADKPFHLIEVKDNGIGFEQQYAQRIFEMFQRLHGKAQYSGTGVGLSIARKVVQNHHGHIWAEGEIDKGATFKVLLPVY